MNVKRRIIRTRHTTFIITYLGLLILAFISLINDYVVQRVNVPTIGIFVLFFIASIFLSRGIRKII